MEKKYGIWGLGVVGKSVLRYLHAHAQEFSVKSLTVMDAKIPSPEDTLFLQSIGAHFVLETEKNTFFNDQDTIIPSPGIDIHEASAYTHKMTEEVDLFFKAWKKPLIAVTGTLGKTSIVHLLSHILEHNGLTIATGGNIGTGMLDLIDQQADYGLLELSSFQLERAVSFTPDLAIITNLYPNHLDRHGDMHSYLLAKHSIMRHQRETQKALIPWTLRTDIRRLSSRPLHFFSAQTISPTELNELGPRDVLYVLEEKSIRKITQSSNEELMNTNQLPAVSYQENWLIILAACDMLSLLKKETFKIPCVELPEHRLECIGIVHGITFYNDSKSTLIQSTIAAADHLAPAPIHLFLGGLGKGVDRSNLIESFKGKVSSIRCFGAESDLLYKGCVAAHIPASAHATLEEAFQACILDAKEGDTILFSPSGSSYDLYKNYKERGDSFSKLVEALKKKELP